jgi:hypothetical protein
MPRDVIPFRAGSNRTAALSGSGPNLAYSALDLFRRLARTLADALPFRDRCRALERAADAWAAPPARWLSEARMEERSASAPNVISDRFAVPAARSRPHAAAAWARLAELLDDAFTACAADISVRHAARAIPGLVERLDEFAPDHHGCAELTALLAVADDRVVTVLHPASGTGFRVRLAGIANFDQFHILLADAIAGAPARGYLAGPRPEPALVDAYRDLPPDPDRSIATARFQFFRPAALRADGTLPDGLGGSEHWLWGHESPRTIPTVEGEPVLLIADAAYPRQWVAKRRFAALDGQLELLNILPHERVADWLRRLGARTVAERSARAA